MKSKIATTNLPDAVLGQMVSYIKGLADSSSRIIYVYPYTQNRTSPPLVEAVGGAVRPRRSKGISDSVKSGRPSVSKRKWAIRVEGNSNPLERNFLSEETAYEYAQRMLRRGDGKSIMVSK